MTIVTDIQKVGRFFFRRE